MDQVKEVGTSGGHRRGLSHGHAHLAQARLAKKLAAEVDAAFRSSRWAVPETTAGILKLYRGAALRHAIALLKDLLDCAKRDSEVAARILGRAHYEATIVGLYVHHGGMTALEQVGGDYVASLKQWQADMDAYNNSLRAALDRAHKRNRSIRRANANRTTFNIANPELPQLELLTEVRVAKQAPLDLDLQPVILAAGDFEPQRLPLRESASRLGRLLRDANDDTAAGEVSYNIVFRSLSTMGAHTNLWVLDAYIAERHKVLLRVGDRLGAKSLIPAITRAAVVLTAFLTLTVLADEADDGNLPTALKIWKDAEAGLRDTDDA